MPNLPVGISSMKLKVSTFEQEISSASLGNNSIQINEEIKTSFYSAIKEIESVKKSYSGTVKFK